MYKIFSQLNQYFLLFCENVIISKCGNVSSKGQKLFSGLVEWKDDLKCSFYHLCLLHWLLLEVVRPPLTMLIMMTSMQNTPTMCCCPSISPANYRLKTWEFCGHYVDSRMFCDILVTHDSVAACPRRQSVRALCCPVCALPRFMFIDIPGLVSFSHIDHILQ